MPNLKNKKVIKDQQGQRKYPGRVTEIQGDTMATTGYGDIPLYVVPNVGNPMVVPANSGNRVFSGASSFTEFPIAKNGGWLEKYGDGGKKPDTSNWKQSSIDSLNLYNQGNEMVKWAKKNPNFTTIEHNKKADELNIKYPISSMPWNKKNAFIGSTNWASINSTKSGQWGVPLYDKPVGVQKKSVQNKTKLDTSNWEQSSLDSLAAYEFGKKQKHIVDGSLNNIATLIDKLTGKAEPNPYVVNSYKGIKKAGLKKVGNQDQFNEYLPYWKKPVGVQKKKEPIKEPVKTQVVNMPNPIDEDRREVNFGQKYQTFNYPGQHGYSGNDVTSKYFDPKTKNEININKSFNSKGDYSPVYLEQKKYGGWLEQYGNGGDFNDYKRPGPVEDRSTGMTGMMKSKIATEAHYGNPSALRMVSPNPKTGMTPEGIGTHYMTSFDNYAVPLLQDKGGKNLEYIENPSISKEDIRFNSPEEAEYFAKHYKEVAPMMRNHEEYKNGGKTDQNPLLKSKTLLLEGNDENPQDLGPDANRSGFGINNKKIHINDNRKIRATTGKKINPNVALKTGDYDENVIDSLIKYAVKYNIEPNRVLAQGLAESTFGKKDSQNIGHLKHFYKNESPYPQMMEAILEGDRLAKTNKNKKTTREEIIQGYNGYGKLFPETEKDYHGGNSKAFYEVPFGKEGYLNMDKNPLYGIEIKDLMDNVIGKDPIIQNKILNVKNPIKEEFYNPNNVKIPYRRKDFKYGGIVKTLQNKQDNSQWLDKYK